MKMKNTFRTLVLAATIAPFLASCASQDEVKRLQYQLHIVNKKLEEMKNTTVDDIRKRQAASSSQIDELETEILSLKAELEETGRMNTILSEKNQELQQSVGTIVREESEAREEALARIKHEQDEKDKLIAELNQKLRMQEENLQAIQDARVRDAERRAREAKARAEAARVKTQAASSSTGSSGKILSIKPDRKKTRDS